MEQKSAKIFHKVGHLGSPWPKYGFKIKLTASSEERDELADFQLLNLPLSVNVLGEEVDLYQYPKGEYNPGGFHENLTLLDLISNKFIVFSSDPLLVLAAEKLVLAGIAKIEALLEELRSFDRG